MSEFDFSILPLPFEKGQWVDADERIFHACFAVLGQYVEKELGTKGDPEDLHRGYRLHSADVEADVDGGSRPSTDRVAIDLWLWYRDELPALVAEYVKDLEDCYLTGDGKSLPTRVRQPKFPFDFPEVSKGQMLNVLIGIRRTLWT